MAMATWQRAREVVMANEEVAGLIAVSRSNGAGCSVLQMLLACRRPAVVGFGPRKRDRAAI